VAIDLNTLKQLIAHRKQWLVWDERNDNSTSQATNDLYAFMERHPTWQAVVYSNSRGLVFIYTENDKYRALRYRDPQNRVAAQMVCEIAEIRIAGWPMSKLSNTFGTYPVTALTGLDTDQPRVHINPANFPVLPDIPA
jgi:hypothetical protein